MMAAWTMLERKRALVIAGMARLNAREQIIATHRLGLGTPALTQKAVGALIGASANRVGQIEQRICQKVSRP